MKLIISCNQCNNLTNSKVEIVDDGTYHLTCENGHTSVVFMQEQQFEILFEMGMLTLLDGYTREAVSSLAASIERFHEFCIRMILAKNKIDANQVEQGWNLLSKQSERQLGAFYLLYLNEFKVSPPAIKNSWIKFRNDVIHKGHFAKEEKVIEYAKYLFEYMIGIIKTFREECWEGYGTVVTRNQENYYSKNSFEAGKISIMSSSTIFDLTNSEFSLETGTFENTLANLKAKINQVYSK
ncbi:hypothetical protein OK414_14800 [Priestia sp. JV24]|uniref:hypothetical protein n=1 Tax=Priestia TaxID=2800373 RepID=UPI0021D68B53|nr:MULTISPECIES: hypothetical protein [Priestia]MCU7712486.1 hypothetical protein [Priestia megaterium]MCW1046315.1 hypothetical protein [Priestia sp. JV24]